MSNRELARKYSVSQSWLRRLKQRRRETGETQPRTGKPGRPGKLTQHLDRLRQLIIAHPDATLRELHAKLGVAVSLTAFWNAIQRLGFSFKKKSFTPPSKTGPTSKSDASNGGKNNRNSTPTRSFSSTKRGPAPT
jgi:transposase